MKPQELDQYLHRHIPLARAMEVSVESIDADGVTLAAPIAPNINHRETVFGGSAAAVAILACWSLLYVRLDALGVAGRIVIQRSTMSYDRPITSGFTARSVCGDAGSWERFLRTLRSKGRARIRISAILEQDGEPVAHFEGYYVALAGENP